jgi:ketosteroid isomerase-like protein
MFEENVELLRSAFEAYGRGDRAAWLSMGSEDLVIEPVGDWPEGSPGIESREAAWDLLVASEEPWEEGPYELTEITEVSDHQLVSHLQREMRGKSSGIEIKYDYWILATIQDRKATRLQWFSSRDEALEASSG